MSILDTIVSALRSLTGGGPPADPESDDRREGRVSVEHDPEVDRSAADASTEAAVKGTDPSDDADGDAVAAGTDATASTGSLVDEDAGREPAEVVGGAGGVDTDRTSDEVDRDARQEPEDAAEESDETDAAQESDDGGEPVETITGIGPAYAGRLETVDIETVEELAAADATTVAEGIDVSESRVGDWIERARDAS